VDSTDKQQGFTRTKQYYGNIPVWTNTMTDETGKIVARIGQNKYELEDNKDGGKILKNIGKQYGGFFKGFLPGGESPSEVKEKNRTLNLGGIEFGDILKLPTNSIAKDAAGNYYYYSADGVYKAPSKDNLTKFLNNTGVASGDIDAKAYPISRDEASSFGSFISQDGKSRIIDDKFLGGISAATSTPQPNLPALNQPVKGTISAAPLPTSTPQNNETANSTPTIVPRKKPGVKEPNQVGTPTINDTMKAQSEQFGSVFAPIFQPFKNMFGKK
jgi:hypothetical protein